MKAISQTLPIQGTTLPSKPPLSNGGYMPCILGWLAFYPLHLAKPCTFKAIIQHTSKVLTRFLSRRTIGGLCRSWNSILNIAYPRYSHKMWARLSTLVSLQDLVNLYSKRPAVMSGLGGHFALEFAHETWALYAVGVLGAVLRWYDSNWTSYYIQHWQRSSTGWLVFDA